MPIDHALILCAGMGTRMGELGKKIPKPLWPVFCKTLLELQVDYCHDLGIDSIFINTHHLSAEIEKFLSLNLKFKNITILKEDPLLDSGGAIHNMASRGDVAYTGNVLLLNADQFLFFDNKYYDEAMNKLKEKRAVLFGIKVPKDAHYNETVLKNGDLFEIKKPEGQIDYITYSGLGILKLDNLLPVPGITKFFETVANYKKEKIGFIVPDDFEYWDFGTAEEYLNSIGNIYHKQQDEKLKVIQFLNRHHALDGKLESFYNPKLDAVDIEGMGNFQARSISGKKIIQKV